jgi:hypothetical protein
MFDSVARTSIAGLRLKLTRCDEPSAADVEILQKLMAVGTSRGRLDFLGGYAPLRVPKRSPPAHRKLGSRLRFYMGGSACLPSRTGGAPIHGWM